MRKYFPMELLICTLAVLVSGCGKAKNPAAKAVEDYYTALVNKDATTLSTLSCADWESNAMLEFDSLQAVTTKLENLSCSATSTEGTTTQVNCQGTLIATYNNENQELDLSVHTYEVVLQDGEYLVCGTK